jgi:hypothetical protein
LNVVVRAILHYYNDESEVERLVRAVAARRFRHDPEVPEATMALDGRIDRFLPAALGQPVQDGAAIKAE